MIILRQHEFGRTGLTKDQAKEWFKGGNGKVNKAAKRLHEINLSNEIMGGKRTINGSDILFVGRDSQSPYESRSKINEGLTRGLFKLSGDRESINHKINIRDLHNSDFISGRPRKDDTWKDTHNFIKNVSQPRQKKFSNRENKFAKRLYEAALGSADSLKKDRIKAATENEMLRKKPRAAIHVYRQLNNK